MELRWVFQQNPYLTIFNELIEAAIKHLRGKRFDLYPDFQTGGHDRCGPTISQGKRGGKVKVRAHIEELDKKTCSRLKVFLTELPLLK